MLNPAYGEKSKIKGWIRFNPGSGAITDQKDVAFVTVHGTGEATITLSEDYSDANFTVTTGVQGGSVGTAYWTSLKSQTASTIRVFTSFGNPFVFNVTNAITHFIWIRK